MNLELSDLTSVAARQARPETTRGFLFPVEGIWIKSLQKVREEACTSWA